MLVYKFVHYTFNQFLVRKSSNKFHLRWPRRVTHAPTSMPDVASLATHAGLLTSMPGTSTWKMQLVGAYNYYP